MVTEVAATLIVTPPSLRRQWVAEIRRHSPGLRVCVYSGWKSLQKGIQKRQDEAIKKEKKRSPDHFVERTVSKYQRLNGGHGQQVKVEEDDYDEEEEVTPVESSLEICQKQFLEYVCAHDVVVTTYG